MAQKARGTSRAQRRQATLDAAKSVQLPTQADVCVVGGGAAGLVAAICAAEELSGRNGDTNARVVVLERARECGQTILATGNGRCNFTNTHLDSAVYNDPAFVRAVTGGAWLEDVLEFFTNGCGLAWEQEDEGRCYPLSRQAASVRNVLLCRAKAAGVVLAPARAVSGVMRRGAGFAMAYREGWGDECQRSLTASRLVLATGGGAKGGALDVCDELKLETVLLEPVLCPLACKGPALAALDGRRVRAEVTLAREGTVVARERGEVMFRPYGLSGIVVFNLSRHARPGMELALDLLPNVSAGDARAMAAHTLDGLLDPAIARALLNEAGTVEGAIGLAKGLRYRVVGKAETNRAQVSRGGLANSQFDPATLEARHVPGLFACGEALNVDGPCGGYNLAWAWKSGMVAGKAAGRLGGSRD